MTDLDRLDTETLAAACRTAAVSSAHADLLNAAAAHMLAMASWIDGAKVDMAALEEAAAKATTWHMEALDDLAACVAERDEARAEVDRLTDLLADVNDSAGQWRRRYEALRDGVLGLCDERDTVDELRFPNSAGAVPTSHLRAVVARVERGES